MIWNKTDCANCPKMEFCSNETRLNINYCGSQRAKNMTRLLRAKEECLALRGLNFLEIKINNKVVALNPAIT